MLSNSTAVAQAIIASLGLRQTLALKLEPELDLTIRAASCKRTPQLAIIIASDIASVVATIGTLKRCWQSIKIVVIGLPNREESILRAFATGAHGVLLEEESLEQLAQAVHEVLAGRYRPPAPLIHSFLERLFQLESCAAGAMRSLPLTRLSARELEVLNCLAQGYSNQAIAGQLHIEVQTVKNHVSQILRKLGVHSRVDASRVAAASARAPQ
ncbi:MAG: response regulator transcription factor [Candidatus Binatia bacterium]